MAMGTEQWRHRPPRSRKLTTGMLSYQSIRWRHAGHADQSGERRERFLGNRKMTTLRKLPRQSPTAVQKNSHQSVTRGRFMESRETTERSRRAMIRDRCSSMNQPYVGQRRDVATEGTWGAGLSPRHVPAARFEGAYSVQSMPSVGHDHLRVVHLESGEPVLGDPPARCCASGERNRQ